MLSEAQKLFSIGLNIKEVSNYEYEQAFLRNQFTRKYELSHEEQQELVKELENINGINFDDRFGDKLNCFIGEMRKQKADENIITKAEKITELKKAERHLQKIIKSFENMDKYFQDDIMHSLWLQNENIINDRYISKFIEQANLLKLACHYNIEDLKKRKNASYFKSVKKTKLIEFALLINKYGIKISTYRESKFADSVKAFLTAYNGKANGIEFIMNVPDDLFILLQKIKKGYVHRIKNPIIYE